MDNEELLRKAAEKKKQEQADKEKKPAEAADPNA
ncbi:MAG: hypothetical protein ACD_41C00348G0001, partial [uncultured bacterium]